MKPEQLKAIAKYMGYEASIEESKFNGEPYYRVYIKSTDPDYELQEYNPLTNAEQCLELIEKVITESSTTKFERFDNGATYIYPDDEEEYKGKTLPEAVLNAAWALVEAEK